LLFGAPPPDAGGGAAGGGGVFRRAGRGARDSPADSGDAYAVVVVGSARTLANKISNAATRLRLDLPPDLLGSMTRSVGLPPVLTPTGRWRWCC